MSEDIIKNNAQILYDIIDGAGASFAYILFKILILLKF